MVDRWKGAALQLSSIQGSKIFRSFYPCHHAESKQLLLPRIVMSPPWQVEGTSVRLQFNDWQGVRMNYSICGASARVIETSFMVRLLFALSAVATFGLAPFGVRLA